MFYKHKFLKNHIHEKALLQQRLAVLSIIILIATLALLARLFFLQVGQYDNYSKKSDNNQYKLEPIAPKRGIIYDRNRKVLAENIPAHRLEITPNKSKNIDLTLTKLSKILNIDQTTINAFKTELESGSKNKVIPLKMKLSEKDIARFYVDKYRYPEAEIKSYLIRSYPNKEIGASVLGYVTHINSLPTDDDERFIYQVNPFKGVIGVESSYEQTLRGIPGYKKLEVNAKGKNIETLEVQSPTPGSNLILTIDIELQKIAQLALKNELGSVVVIDPNNGEILALATNPSYDPNYFVTGITKQMIKKLSNSDTKPMFNRAIKGQFPLASTIKPFLGLGALDKDIIDPSDSIYDKGHYIYPNTTHVYRDWKLDGHGKVNLHKAIKISCDTYFYELSIKMGIENIVDTLDKFGFGHKTNIDLDDEAQGLIATPIWKKEHKGAPWYVGDTILSGIGQGFLLTTPLQLAQATATLANHGYGYTPHLIKSTITASGENNPAIAQPLAPFIVSDDNWNIVTTAMEAVVKQGGTGFRFGYDHPYSIAAKTGTAQLYRNEMKVANETMPKRIRDHSLFIGFSPTKNAKLAVAVIAENSEIAPKVARAVFDQYYHIKND
ncbi:MAG: penicillin-binding protein 2 [Legionellales bacterium]|jgi:penicillin-binding protein 2|nr:penicillin-binding protein 2 [Legionellales bacterium]